MSAGLAGSSISERRLKSRSKITTPPLRVARRCRGPKVETPTITASALIAIPRVISRSLTLIRVPSDPMISPDIEAECQRIPCSSSTMS